MYGELLLKEQQKVIKMKNFVFDRIIYNQEYLLLHANRNNVPILLIYNYADNCRKTRTRVLDCFSKLAL